MLGHEPEGDEPRIDSRWTTHREVRERGRRRGRRIDANTICTLADLIPGDVLAVEVEPGNCRFVAFVWTTKKAAALRPFKRDGREDTRAPLFHLPFTTRCRPLKLRRK